uniref:Uncharacterized protein LOC102809799 n=1 Tax=Saccoglossus kowalevskii TaxID=10224 RepID=A0ABM0M4R6_SACKO|nr:PREDICTED: uncharacterized protein LOC102809799 [Saccoglossus kowalevskii]
MAERKRDVIMTSSMTSHMRHLENNNLDIDAEKREEDLLHAVTEAIPLPYLFILDVTDNFFEVGGTKVTAAVVVRMLRKRGYELTLSDMFQASVLRDILNVMRPLKFEQEHLPNAVRTSLKSKPGSTCPRTNNCQCAPDVASLTRVATKDSDVELVCFADATKEEVYKVFSLCVQSLLKLEPMELCLDMSDTDKHVFVSSALREIFHNPSCQSLSFLLRHKITKEVKAAMLSADFFYQCHPSYEGIPCLPWQAFLFTIVDLERRHKRILGVTTPRKWVCHVLSVTNLYDDPYTQLSLHRRLNHEGPLLAGQNGYSDAVCFYANPLLQECAAEAGFKVVGSSQLLRETKYKEWRFFPEIMPDDSRYLVMTRRIDYKV